MGVITPFYNDTINPVILVCSDCTWREQGCKVSRSVYIRRPDYGPVGDHGGKSRRIDGFPIIHTGQSAGFRRWRPRCESARVAHQSFGRGFDSRRENSRTEWIFACRPVIHHPVDQMIEFTGRVAASDEHWILVVVAAMLIVFVRMQPHSCRGMQEIPHTIWLWPVTGSLYGATPGLSHLIVTNRVSMAGVTAAHKDAVMAVFAALTKRKVCELGSCCSDILEFLGS